LVACAWRRRWYTPVESLVEPTCVTKQQRRRCSAAVALSPRRQAAPDGPLAPAVPVLPCADVAAQLPVVQEPVRGRAWRPDRRHHGRTAGASCRLHMPPAAPCRPDAPPAPPPHTTPHLSWPTLLCRACPTRCWLACRRNTACSAPWRRRSPTPSLGAPGTSPSALSPW
jgi:hypothetical protein